jgi:hypothetical protein
MELRIYPVKNRLTISKNFVKKLDTVEIKFLAYYMVDCDRALV